MLLTLIKYRLKMLLSFFKGGKKIGQTLALIVAFLLLAVMFVSFSIGIYEMAKLNPEAGEKFIDSLLALSFHGMFLVLCFWGLSMAILIIFFSNDLELLLTLPIKTRDIFIYKISDATFQNVRISLLFLIPSLVILGIYYHAYFLYYIIAILVALFMAAIPGALGIIIASFLSRKIPKARLKGSMTVIGSVIGVVFWAVMNRFNGRFSSETSNINNLPFAGMAKYVSSPLFQWLPSGWAYQATRNAAFGQWSQSLEYLAILAVVSIGLIYVAMIVISRYYASGIGEEVALPSAAIAGINMGGSPLMAHIRRDLVLFWREPGAMAQSLIMLAFLVLFPFVAGGKQMDDIPNVPLSPFIALFAAFFGGQLGSRLIPIERLGFWQNLVTPNGRNLTIFSKTILGLVFVTIFTVLAGIFHFLTGRITNPAAIFLMIGFSWTGLALGIPLGVSFANFKWEHPRRMITGTGGFFYAFGMILVFGVLYGALYLVSRFLSNFINPTIFILFIGCGFLVISLAISVLKLTNMEWNPET
jgi:ABC-2 type transport system permease protein